MPVGAAHEHVGGVGGDEGLVEDVEILLGDLLGGVGGGHVGGDIDADELRCRGVVTVALGIVEGGVLDGEVAGHVVADVVGVVGEDLVVPVPVDESEGRVAEEASEDSLVEVEVEAVPRHEEPGEVDLECDVGVQLLVGSVAEGAVHVRLDLKAPGIVVGERLHEFVRTVELGDVICIGFVGGPADLLVLDGVIIPGEVAEGAIVGEAAIEDHGGVVGGRVRRGGDCLLALAEIGGLEGFC